MLCVIAIGRSQWASRHSVNMLANPRSMYQPSSFCRFIGIPSFNCVFLSFVVVFRGKEVDVVADFQTFPRNRAEALTMLYLQNQDLSACSPEELADKYFEVLKAIKGQCQKHANAGWGLA